MASKSSESTIAIISFQRAFSPLRNKRHDGPWLDYPSLLAALGDTNASSGVGCRLNSSLRYLQWFQRGTKAVNAISKVVAAQAALVHTHHTIMDPSRKFRRTFGSVQDELELPSIFFTFEKEVCVFLIYSELRSAQKLVVSTIITVVWGKRDSCN